ncbi:hypothetical protein chiPu_0018178 [Chiloscyllium punctatum]|uniref:Uncharacterized protein n=1 Tax=Chiloscyllium punctatum TaxID=137246 RepID=A0A401RLQ0_CHIPU|nr:hypothetical protein [Chiloscyllium punctatum]
MIVRSSEGAELGGGVSGSPLGLHAPVPAAGSGSGPAPVSSWARGPRETLPAPGERRCGLVLPRGPGEARDDLGAVLNPIIQ